MRIYPNRSLCLQASKKANMRIIAAVVIVLVVVAAAVVTAAYYYLSITIPSRNWATQSPTPTPSLTPSPAPGSTTTPIPSTPPASTPNLPASPTPTIPKYSLSEAISAGYVEANITGTSGLGAIFGASSGDSIILNIKRLVNYTIEIEAIPIGTLLVPASGDTQNMAVLNLKGLNAGFMYYIRDRIILDTPNTTQYLFSAYCVNINKRNPTESTTFTPNGLADANVLKIYEILNQLPKNITKIASIQTAVFVVTDNVSRNELQERFSAGVAEIQNARTILEKAGIDISNKRLFT